MSDFSYEYQNYGRFFAQVPREMEKIAAEEIEKLGGEDVRDSYRGVYFYANQENLYRIVYSARLITRVLAPILTFQCHTTKYLTKTAHNIPWEDIFSLDQTFAINATVANSNITHSM